MRLPLFAAITMLAAVAGAAQAQPAPGAPDGSSTYTPPPGFEVIDDIPLRADQAGFAVVRSVGGRRARVGACVVGISTLGGSPNLETWAGMIAAHRTDTEAKARARAVAPMTFVSLGGYRDLALKDGGDGYLYWFDQRRPDGLSETRLIAVGLIKPRSLFAGDCTSAKGLSFTPAEVERIVKLVSSVRRP